MPNITIYLDNETHIGFLNLKDEKRTELRKEFAETIKNEIFILNHLKKQKELMEKGK